MFETKDSKELRALIRAAQEGDEQAFEQILTLLEAQVYRLAFSMLRHKQDAEDATQETFIKQWRTLPSYRFECPILPYVLKMTRTTVLDMQRKIERRREHELSLTLENDQGERVELDLADTDVQNDPVAHLSKMELIAQVRQAIEDLPPEHRDILLLKDMQGLSYEQIAQTLDIQVGTVASRLSRARKNLEKILKTRKIF
ncbi:MAG: RNA polymerase sigma factor [Clostridia bacterium]|nr:RNA polymerase sigma factor [Clostridia bacterium]